MSKVAGALKNWIIAVSENRRRNDPTVFDCRMGRFWCGSRGNGYRNSHRNEEVACEQIRVEVAEGRCDTQLFGGDPTVRFAPFQTSGREAFNRFLQIHRSHRVGVDAHVLRKETRESFQTSAF